MKKLLVSVVAALTLVGCYDYEEIKQDKTYVAPLLGRIKEVCINGVVYLVANEKGITPKINKDFYPYTCNKSQIKE